MRTIERVAELLGPLEQPGSKPAEPRDPHLLERAASKSALHPGLAEVREVAAQLEANVLARELKANALLERPAGEPWQIPGKSQEILRIDRNHLRRQSMITTDGVRTPNAESFRRIKRQILGNVAKSRAGVPSNLVLVTSALPQEGKTFCAVNLAISIALEMDRTVLLVDADVAKPSVPKVLGINAERGLLDVLLDRRIDLAEVLRKTDIGKLTLLPAGTANSHATELLASDSMRVLLQEMAERYSDRIVIFDSPPLLAASEAGVLASQVGQIVMVVEAGKTSEAALKAALGCIETGNIAGLLLNKGEALGPGYHYGEYGNPAM